MRSCCVVKSLRLSRRLKQQKVPPSPEGFQRGESKSVPLFVFLISIALEKGAPRERAYEGKRWKGIGNGVTMKEWGNNMGKQVGIQLTQFEHLHLDWKTSVDKRGASTNERLLGSQANSNIYTALLLLDTFISISSLPPTRTSSFSLLTYPTFISSNPFVIHFFSPPSTSLRLAALAFPLFSNPVTVSNSCL